MTEYEKCLRMSGNEKAGRAKHDGWGGGRENDTSHDSGYAREKSAAIDR